MFYICYFTYIFHIYVTLNSSHPKDNATFCPFCCVWKRVHPPCGGWQHGGGGEHFQMRNRIAPSSHPDGAAQAEMLGSTGSRRFSQ